VIFRIVSKEEGFLFNLKLNTVQALVHAYAKQQLHLAAELS
jgi:hypothetical protein